MSAASSRWNLAQDILKTLQDGDITQDDAEFLLWLAEHKSCPLGHPGGRFSPVKITDRQVRTLLIHYRQYRNPVKFTPAWNPLVRRPITEQAQDAKLDSLIRY